jgi:mannosyltransferase OCH1-like enzyme
MSKAAQAELLTIEPQVERIPRVIHTCWFGRGPKPRIVESCMESWRDVLPDYRIQVWDESNMDVRGNAYARGAYNVKKWAFVTDYVRLRALFFEGGIYMDADVEVVRPLDRFLVHRAFTGHETPELMVAATMGAEKGHPWIRMLLAHYGKARFDAARPVPNTRTITALSRPWVDRELYGFRYLREGVVIYPVDVFAPYDHQRLAPLVTEHTHAIHHFAGTWLGRTKT